MTSVAHIEPKSRTERPRKTKISTVDSPRHTWLGYHFQGQNVKGQLAGGGAYCGGLPHSLLLLPYSWKMTSPGDRKCNREPSVRSQHVVSSSRRSVRPWRARQGWGCAEWRHGSRPTVADHIAPASRRRRPTQRNYRQGPHRRRQRAWAARSCRRPRTRACRRLWLRRSQARTCCTAAAAARPHGSHTAS